MKLVVAGSRSIKDYQILREAVILSGLWQKYGKKIVVVSGEAPGVDTLGEEFASKAGCKVVKKPADWDNIATMGAVVKVNKAGKKYNALAGMWRNDEMAEEADEALIVWDGKSPGSLNMLHNMLQREKPVYLYALKISVDLCDSLEAKGCTILFPNKGE